MKIVVYRKERSVKKIVNGLNFVGACLIAPFVVLAMMAVYGIVFVCAILIAVVEAMSNDIGKMTADIVISVGDRLVGLVSATK